MSYHSVQGQDGYGRPDPICNATLIDAQLIRDSTSSTQACTRPKKASPLSRSLMSST
jgi:hypothetical protein